jgi:hypothetical protein
MNRSGCEQVCLPCDRLPPASAIEQHVFADGEGERTGWWLVEAMQASPCRDADLEPGRERMPVRDVGL